MKSTVQRFFLAREGILFLALLFMVIVFSVTVDGFLDAASILRRSRYWVAMGMVAVPMTFIIATAGIDLSVGSIVALSGMALGLLYGDAGWPIAVAAVAAVGVGTLAGAFNGGVSSYLRVPPLVVTLATMALFRGIAMGLSQARSIGGFPDGFRYLDRGNALDLFGAGQYFELPVSLVAMLFVFVFGALLLRRTWIGRFTQCLGENETAASFAAIDVRKMKWALYTAMGTVCGVAALFHTALYGTAKADTAAGMELEAIACVVVGGTRISGGHASVLGTLLGLLIIGMLRYGLEMAGVRSQNVIIFVGMLLIATAVFNEAMAAKTGGSK